MTKKSCFNGSLFLFFLIFCGQIEAQLTTNNYFVYRSRNPKIDSNYSYLEMRSVNLGSIYETSLDTASEEGRKHQELLRGGIQANVGVGGEVDLKVYLYDENQPDGKGSLVYGCYTQDKICDLSSCGSQWREYSKFRKTQDPLNISRQIDVLEKDIKSNLQSIKWKGLECKESTSVNSAQVPAFNWGHMAIAGIVGAEAGCRSLFTFSPPMYKLPACALGGALAGAWALGQYGLFKSVSNSEPLTATQRNCYLKSSELQAVIIELEVWNATVNKIKVPLMEEIDLTNQDPNYAYHDFFVQPPSSASVTITLNGDSSTQRTISLANSDIPTIFTTLGDELQFNINADSPTTPDFTGLPSVWRANFSGEVLYYCSPSINPGELKPFLGFEAQDSEVSIRRYPAEWQLHPELIHEKNFVYTHNQNNTYTNAWTYTVTREMSASAPANYSPIVYKWPVGESIFGSNVKKRYNQREGYNMELLGSSPIVSSFLLNLIPGIDSKYLDPSTSPKYSFLGFGGDEVLYMGSKFPDTKTHGFSMNGGLFQVTNPTAPFSPSKSTALLPWQQIWEDTNTTSVLNLMVDAYRLSKGEFTTNYDGYEIQDLGMGKRDGNGQIIETTEGTIDFPEGVGSGNAKAPGLVTIDLDGKKVQFKLEAKAPFSDGKYKGFYSQIEGPKYPAIGEQDVAYTLMGLEELPSEEIKKYYLQYDYEDEHGNLKSEPARAQQYGGTSEEDKNRLYASDGNLVSKFSIGGAAGKNGYGFHSITAYYKRCATCTPVPIAGKELLATGLRFVNIKLKNAPYTIEDDPIDSYQGERKKIEGIGEYSKEFTFKQGDQVNININDYDQTFSKTATQGYDFSKRHQSHSISSTQIREGLNTYLTPLGNSKGSAISREPTFDYAFQESGNYMLECNYRGYAVHHLIHVVPAEGYGSVGAITLKGKIESTVEFPEKGLRAPSIETIKEFRDLSKDIVGAVPESWQDENNFGGRYIMAEMRFIYSDYMYGAGTDTASEQEGHFPRAYTDLAHKNKYGNYNDLGHTIQWYFGKDSVKALIHNDGYVKDFLNNYLTNTSSGLGYQSWYPDVWVRRYSDNKEGDPLRYFPQDMKTNSDGSLAYSLSQQTVEGLLDTYFSQSGFVNDFEPWQKRLPLIVWAKYDGPRVRREAKVIINLERFYNSSTGAFSGTPFELPADYLAMVNPEIMTNNQLAVKNFYTKFVNMHGIIFDASKNSDGTDNMDYYDNKQLFYNLSGRMSSSQGTNTREWIEPNNNPPPPNPNPNGDDNEEEEEQEEQEQEEELIANVGLTLTKAAPDLGPFLYGADLSSANQYDACGVKFRVLQGNPEEDIFDIFQKTDHNLVNVRVWYGPKWIQYFYPIHGNNDDSDDNNDDSDDNSDDSDDNSDDSDDNSDDSDDNSDDSDDNNDDTDVNSDDSDVNSDDSDVNYTKAMNNAGIEAFKTILRAKQAGMKVLLTIEYSDAWVLEDTYNPPHRWRHSTSMEILKLEVKSYTSSLLEHFEYLNRNSEFPMEDFLPDYIQIGADISHGMFYSESRLDLPTHQPPLPSIAQYRPPRLGNGFPRDLYIGERNFAGDILTADQRRRAAVNTVAILNAGIQGVKDYCGDLLRRRGLTKKIYTVLQMGDVEQANSFLETYLNPAVADSGIGSLDYDIIGLEIPHTINTNTIEYRTTLLGGISALRSRYGKNVMIVKTFYNFTNAQADALTNIGTNSMDPNPSPENVLVYHAENALAVKRGGGMGLAVWQPNAVSLGDNGPFQTLWGRGSVSENSALFFFNKPVNGVPTYRPHVGIFWPVFAKDWEDRPSEVYEANKEFHYEKIKSIITEEQTQEQITDKEQGMMVSPNPTNSRFTLQFESPVKQVELQLIDMEGIQVDYKKLDHESTSFEVQLNKTIAEGIYFVRATTNQGVFKTKIVIKR